MRVSTLLLLSTILLELLDLSLSTTVQDELRPAERSEFWANQTSRLRSNRVKRETDYCSLPCKKGVHTMCKYQTSNPGHLCNGGWKGVGLTREQKVALLDIHNRLRSEIAVGKTPQPKAADMIQLVWDKELSEVAKRWADQCDFNHDKCRISERFSVGQNLAIQSVMVGWDPALAEPGYQYFSDEVGNRLEKMVQGWFDEISDFPPAQVGEYTGESTGGAVGHYTQMAWAQTRRVGCGVSVWRTVIKGTMKTSYMLACNYGPAGNFLGNPVYEEGEPCSHCPENTVCSEQFEGICSTGEESDFSGALLVVGATPMLLMLLLSVLFMFSNNYS